MCLLINMLGFYGTNTTTFSPTSHAHQGIKGEQIIVHHSLNPTNVE